MVKASSSQQKEEKISALTYYSKDQIVCPICNTRFKREELKSGGGRLIAGDLTDELRRLYEPSAKYGEVYPLIYAITVCPKCNYAAFPQDFLVLDKDSLNAVYERMQDRYQSIKNLFGSLDFVRNRTLKEGAASYYLAILCYEHINLKFSPTIKRALCSLRAAWLFSDLDKKYPEDNYAYVSSLFYHKALFFYRLAVELETCGKEMIASLKSFGPDLDKNYGFDGVLYLSALLEYKYGSKENLELRNKLLAAQRRSLAKMFGLGRSSKNKPGPLLEHARALYDAIVAELAERGEEESD